MASPESLLPSVQNASSFLEFAKALASEREVDAVAETQAPSSPDGPTKAGWENTTLEGFLEAAVAWASDSGFIHTTGNPWQEFARFLLAGKAYE